MFYCLVQSSRSLVRKVSPMSSTHPVEQASHGGAAPNWLGAAQLKAGGSFPMKLRWLLPPSNEAPGAPKLIRILSNKKVLQGTLGNKSLPGGESNPGLPRDRRGYSPLYYRGTWTLDSGNFGLLLVMIMALCSCISACIAIFIFTLYHANSVFRFTSHGQK